MTVLALHSLLFVVFFVMFTFVVIHQLPYNTITIHCDPLDYMSPALVPSDVSA